MSAYVTHGVFPKESWNKFKADNGGEGGGAGRGVKPTCWLWSSIAVICVRLAWQDDCGTGQRCVHAPMLCSHPGWVAAQYHHIFGFHFSSRDNVGIHCASDHKLCMFVLQMVQMVDSVTSG